MSDGFRFRVTATTLSPLHIGSGERLREGFDFIEHDGSLWVADQGALMRAILDEVARERGDLALAAEAITGMTLDELREADRLRAEYFDLERGLFRYRLQGQTSTKGKQGEVHEQIKDVYGRPYLPGSSLKGALRSVLMRQLSAKDERKPVILRKHRGERWIEDQKVPVYDARSAAQGMEKRYFVPANVSPQQQPNYDLWRAFRVSDSEPVPTSALALAHILVFPAAAEGQGAGAGIPLEAEAIRQDVTFMLSIQVDRWLFDSPAAEKLRFERKHLAWFTGRLRGMVNREAHARLLEDAEFFDALHDRHEVKTAMAALYRLTDELKGLAPDEMMLQVGRGAGWRSKTLEQVLQDRLPEEEFEQLVQDFNLGRGRWRKDGRVPRTRQLATAGDQVRAPMGWMKVRLEEVK